MRRFGGLAALAALGVLSAATYAGALAAAVWLGVGLLAAHPVVVAVLFVLYLAAAWLVRARILPTKKALAVVLGFGLLFRVLMLPTPVYLSSDLFRYLWDGRVQLAGVNPYRYAPSAPELAHLRDSEIHPRINRPAARTIYPPAAQWLFALAAALAPGSIAGWRLLLLLFEGAPVAMLLLLLRRLGVPPTAVIIYAWSARHLRGSPGGTCGGRHDPARSPCAPPAPDRIAGRRRGCARRCRAHEALPRRAPARVVAPRRF